MLLAIIVYCLAIIFEWDFIENYYWKLTTEEIAAEHPKLISEKWRGLPGNIDAAFAHEGWTYFFKVG